MVPIFEAVEDCFLAGVSLSAAVDLLTGGIVYVTPSFSTFPFPSFALFSSTKSTKDGHYQVYGIPWCGTSGIFTTKTYPLGGIILLGRASDDHLETLDDTLKTLRVMQRLISPSWTPEGLERNLDFAAELSREIPIFHLCCTKNPSAVDVVKAAIDKEEGSRHA